MISLAVSLIYKKICSQTVFAIFLISCVSCLVDLENTVSQNTAPPTNLEKHIPQEIKLEVITPTGVPTPSPTTSPIPTPKTTDTPIPVPTVPPTSIPTPIPIPIQTAPTVEPSETPQANAAFIITIAIEQNQPSPDINAKLVGVKNKDNSYWVDIEMKSTVETFDKVVKKVIINDSFEYVVRLSKYNTNSFIGQFNIDDHLLKEKTLKWVIDNLDVRIENFPERVACTGSMRPIIYCGDLVKYEPANHGEELKVGDIVTFRQLVSDIDASTECPVYDDVITIIEGYIIHRIVQVLPSYNVTRYMTRGDNNPEQDSCLVKEEHVIQRVTEIIPRYYVTNDLEYDFNQSTHQNLLEERNILMADYRLALAEYNTSRGKGAAESLTSIIYQLETNLTSMQQAQQAIYDAVFWED